MTELINQRCGMTERLNERCQLQNPHVHLRSP